MKAKSKHFSCADLPESVVESIRRYETELRRITGRELILIAYEEDKN